MTRKYKMGGSGKGNFAFNPTLYPSTDSYVRGQGCPGSYNNVTAAKGDYSKSPYVSNMKGGNSVYGFAKPPIYKNSAGQQITPYGPQGGIYANVYSPPAFTGPRPEQIMGGGKGLSGDTVAATLAERNALNRVYSDRAYTRRETGPIGPGWAGGGKSRRSRKNKKNPRRKRVNKTKKAHNKGKKASKAKKTKKFKRGTKSKTHTGKDFETRKNSKYYRRRFRGVGARDLLAPVFPFVGGSGTGRGIKGYTSFKTSPTNVPPPTGPSQAQPYSNKPISFGYSAGAPPDIGPNQSALANPSPHSAYMNCPKNNFTQPN